MHKLSWRLRKEVRGGMSTHCSSKHVGILVIHGIGNENPYGTLDSFARGLYRHFECAGPSGYQMAAAWKERGSDPSHEQQSWIQAEIRFEPGAGSVAEEAGAPHITMAEYYWSPATKRRLKDFDVLTWLFRTGLEPFRYLSENLQVMQQAEGERKSTGKEHAFDSGVIALRELFRLAFLYVPLLLAIVALGAFLENLPALPGIVSSINWKFPHDAIALVAIVRLVVLYSLSGYLLGYCKWMRFRVPIAGPERRFGRFTLLGAVLIFVGVVILPMWLAQQVPDTATVASTAFWHPNPTMLGAFGKWIVSHWMIDAWALLYNGIVFVQPDLDRFLLLDGKFLPVLLPLLSLSVAALVRAFFVDFLGDIAIYTNLNQRSANFAIRAQILEECGHALTSLYLDLREESFESGTDFHIIIAAHSLGTVIAYDTLNDLFNRARIGAAPVGSTGASHAPITSMEICSHVRGLLTFGCPLNKIYYFFRDQSAAEELVRAQIIDGLHSFRLAAPAHSLPGAPVASLPSNLRVDSLANQLLWINVWASSDVVSGKLFFYRTSLQIHRRYLAPFPFSHLRYWRDQEMYQIFVKNLLQI